MFVSNMHYNKMNIILIRHVSKYTNDGVFCCVYFF